MRALRRIILILLLAAIVYPLWLAFRVWDQSHNDEVRRADAIVVLGAAQYDGRPSLVYRARLDQALYLYGEGLADAIIVTGGKKPGDQYTEAEAGRMYLVDADVPPEVILSEDRGRTTFESLRGARRVAAEHAIETGLFVSDPLHSERIKRMALDLGFQEAHTSPASYTRLGRSRETKMEEIVHEVLSLLAYQFLQR